jgi:hypothetical protein
LASFANFPFWFPVSTLNMSTVDIFVYRFDLFFTSQLHKVSGSDDLERPWNKIKQSERVHKEENLNCQQDCLIFASIARKELKFQFFKAGQLTDL